MGWMRQSDVQQVLESTRKLISIILLERVERVVKAGLVYNFERATARPLQHVDLGRAKVNLGHEGISELSQKRYIEDSTSDSGFHAYLVDDVVEHGQHEFEIARREHWIESFALSSMVFT